ncbi:dnaJ homolog subfamily C member 11 [Orussus abietinus]|uniref:dnaJ homolog subfamily C member 11 n=1 Tax=Orussus abietinus TaxID=222816 RepID=UPI000625A443|nr:dnaJ homolog subfamily C member 11 [Orussus abietinus]
MDDETEQEGLIEEDFYTFLNVSRDATPEEINNAYRKLSRIYHPDKHTNPDLKKDAEVLFNRTKKAYEVLSDPHQRAIYDTVGMKGLETEGWEIVQRTKTPQEIREEYEQLAMERQERRLQQRTNPKGTITVNVNATDLFARYDEDYEAPDGLFSSIEVSGLSISQSIEAPLTLKDTITMSGQLGIQNGNGSGTVNLSARRLISSKGSIEFDVGVGNGPTFSVKGFRTITKNLFCNGAVVLHFKNEDWPNIVGTLAQRLDKHTIGYLTYRGGGQNAMSTMVVRNTNQSCTTFSLELGLVHSYVSLSYTYKMEEKELKLRGCVKAGSFGAFIEYGAQKKVSQHSSISAAVRVGVPTGVTLRIKLIRASQIYSFPIHLCEEVLIAPVFYATVVPLFTWTIIKKFVIDPAVKEQEEKKKKKQREVNKTRMMEKQRDAKAAVSLMRATFSRNRSEEESKGGLVITKALYGRVVYPQDRSAGDDASTGHRDEVIDVTVPLQCLVKDSKLILHNASKSQLPGFYDPCVGEDKQLFVQYLFHGQTHECIIKDDERLRIPMESHRVNTT